MPVIGEGSGDSGDRSGLNAQYADYVRLLDREPGILPPDDLVGFCESLIGAVPEKSELPGESRKEA